MFATGVAAAQHNEPRPLIRVFSHEGNFTRVQRDMQCILLPCPQTDNLAHLFQASANVDNVEEIAWGVCSLGNGFGNCRGVGREHVVGVEAAHVESGDGLFHSVDEAPHGGHQGDRPVLHRVQLDQPARLKARRHQHEICACTAHIREFSLLSNCRINVVQHEVRACAARICLFLHSLHTPCH